MRGFTPLKKKKSKFGKLKLVQSEEVMRNIDLMANNCYSIPRFYYLHKTLNALIFQRCRFQLCYDNGDLTMFVEVYKPSCDDSLVNRHCRLI